METIHAAHSLSIEFTPTTWRLVNGSRLPDQPEVSPALLEATPTSISCFPAFARARQLPSSQLTPVDIARVVVGWAPESHNWHLGLLLAARPETGYQTNWCGLATWPSGPAPESVDQATQAGKSLAQLLDRPFYLVPPPIEQRAPSIGDTQPYQTTTRLEVPKIVEPIPQIEPKQPPFTFEQMALLPMSRGYVWQKRSSWILGTAGRVLGLILMAGVFLFLGIGSQTAGLAPVTPGWLPWLGIGVAIVLFFMGLSAFGTLLGVSDILIDSTMNEIRCQSRLGGRVQWRVPFESILYVLISQTPAHSQGRKKQDGSAPMIQDVWLHVYDGNKFWQIAELKNVEGISHRWDSVRASQKRHGYRRVDLSDYDTPAHHAVRLMEKVMQTESWLDIK